VCTGVLAFTGGSGELERDNAPQLPFSGAPVGPLGLTGGLLLVSGAATVVVARRRTTQVRQDGLANR
jgi:hypothetical protein